MKTCILVLFAIVQSVAQFTLDKKINPQELKMVDYKKGDKLMSGKICIAKITQQQDTAYFNVKGAGIYQPVVVTISNRKPNQKLAVAFCKNNWNKPERNGTVDDKKPYTEKFKTEGSFGIRVISKQLKPNYQIVVWIGDEPKTISMKNAFTVQSKLKTKK